MTKRTYRAAMPLDSANTATGTVGIAIRIAARFHTEVPTTAQLCSAFGMSRATAFRGRRAIADALGKVI